MKKVKKLIEKRLQIKSCFQHLICGPIESACVQRFICLLFLLYFYEWIGFTIGSIDLKTSWATLQVIAMASRWSTSQLIAEHKDLQVSDNKQKIRNSLKMRLFFTNRWPKQAVCLAISIDGRCALSSRRSISIINCNKPDVIDIRIKRETKWDSTATEFNQLDSNLLAITNAQSVQIYNIEANIKRKPILLFKILFPTLIPFLRSIASDLNNGNSVVKDQQMVTLKGHTRTITDLNWSYSDVHSLATASYDNNMHIWDIRDSRKPMLSMSSVAGATQVKWSKMNEHVLATSHEGDVRVWDKRKSNTPVHYITAHLSKINGLDWNPNIGSQFATCSQDGTVRVCLPLSHHISSLSLEINYCFSSGIWRHLRESLTLFLRLVCPYGGPGLRYFMINWISI